jgi:ABC-2 type transport system permease protein/lipopolysaccharide transport system permease protein
VVFNRVADIDTGGVPYVLFSYIALVPWNFFSTSVSSGGMSVITQMSLVNKLRCPREVFPLASMTTSALNALIASAVLIVLFAAEGFWPKATAPWIFVALAVQLVFTTAVTLTVAAVTVYLRDVRHALPILLQVALFATPVAYGIDFVPHGWQVPYVIVNPMAAVITTYRETVLIGNGPPWHLLLPAAGASIAMLYGSIRMFRRLELGFADVA